MTSPLSRRSVLAALAGAAWLPLRPAHAELSVDERLPLIRPRATRLRNSLRSKWLDPYRIEADYQEAIVRAEQAWNTDQPEQALLALSPLQRYAPIAELPFIKAQLLMAAIAEQQRQSDLVRHHRAFATVLVQLIDATGNGLSEKTAFKLVLPSEADGWFIAHGRDYRPQAKMMVSRRQQSHDLWRALDAQGQERTLYFDVSAMLRSVNPPPAER